MNDILKQRLVGALILVALGVVFWPIIFVEPGDQPAAEQPRIPPRPAVDTTAIEAPDMAGLRPSQEVEAQKEARAAELAWPVPAPGAKKQAETNAVATAPAVVEEQKPAASVAKTPSAPKKQTRTEPPEKLVVDSDGVPVAWILQVASVSSSDKADELRDRLLKVDQKAYVKRVKSNGKSLYRVYIGPKFERAALESIQPRIDREFGVKSMIARYVP